MQFADSQIPTALTLMENASVNIYLNQIYNLSLKNKYATYYCNLIEKSLKRSKTKQELSLLIKSDSNINGYCEKHHILPKSFGLGGYRDFNNYVFLTAREHFIAHRLLAKMFSKENKFYFKMIYAINLMTNANSYNFPISNRIYEYIRIELSKISVSESTKKKRSSANIGRIHIIQLIKGYHKIIHPEDFEKYKKEGYIKGCPQQSTEAKERTRQSNIGKIVIYKDHHNKRINPEDLLKYENIGYIKGPDPETYQKLKGKKRPKKKCIYCGKILDIGNYTKLHGDYCVKNPNRIIKENKSCEYCGLACSPNTLSLYHGKNCKLNPTNLTDDLKCKYCYKYFLPEELELWHNEKCKENPNRLNPSQKECEFCGMIISKVNYTRWHGLNCKLNPDQHRLSYYCKYCKQNIDPGNYARLHGDKCKLNPNRRQDEKIECIYCHKMVDPFNYKRWHGNRCKVNPINIGS